MSQMRPKPTMGFEPMTPALRERCSGQLSYVGVGGECSRGSALAQHGSEAEDARRMPILGTPYRARLDAVAARRGAPHPPLPLGPHARDALRTRPLLARRGRRDRADRPRGQAVAGGVLPAGPV